jgi:hypothetical protein
VPVNGFQVVGSRSHEDAVRIQYGRMRFHRSQKIGA